MLNMSRRTSNFKLSKNCMSKDSASERCYIYVLSSHIHLHLAGMVWNDTGRPDFKSNLANYTVLHIIYKDIGARSGYLYHGQVTTSHRIQWNVITCPCSWFLLLAHKSSYINTLRPRQNWRHFADDILKYIFLNENVWIPNEVCSYGFN